MTLSHEDDITSVAISGDGKLIASGSKDKSLKLWELATGKLIFTINHHEKIGAVAFNRDRTLVTGCQKGNIRLFKPQSHNLLQELLK